MIIFSSQLMVSTLIIYAHPKTKGHNSVILEQVRHELILRERDFEIIDLYDIGYDPVLADKEHYTSGNKHLSSQNKQFQKKIEKANHLIVIFPVWWGGMPAILKGFFDRVLTSRFAYRYVPLPFPLFNLKFRPVGLLKGKRAAVFMTIGSPRWIHTLYTRNSQQFTMKWNVLGFCGIKTKTFTLGNCATPVDEKKKKKIKRLVTKGLRWLF